MCIIFLLHNNTYTQYLFKSPNELISYMYMSYNLLFSLNGIV